MYGVYEMIEYTKANNPYSDKNFIKQFQQFWIYLQFSIDTVMTIISAIWYSFAFQKENCKIIWFIHYLKDVVGSIHVVYAMCIGCLVMLILWNVLVI